MRTFLPPSAADLHLRDVERQAAHRDAASNIGVVLHLTGAVPELAALRQHVADRLAVLPCLGHQLDDDGRTARWTHAHPDLDHHIRARQVPEGTDSLDATAREIARERWPDGVPSWQLILLHGHAPDGYALLYLAHHTLQDGGSILAVLEALFAPPGPAEQSTAVARGVPHTPSLRPRQLLRTARTLLRTFGKHGMWNSPDQPLSSRRHLLWAHAPASWLRTAARGGGASTHDVFLTALGQALAEWAPTCWPRAAARALPVLVPVNLRTADEVTAPGNRLFPTRLDLPGGAMALAQRLAHTRTLTTALKSAEHKAVLRAAITRLPTRPLRRLVALTADPGRLSVGASYLVMRHRLGYAGAEVTRMDPIMCCPPGVPLAVVVLVYGETASACFRIDTALPDGASLPARWRQALEELSGTAEPVAAS